MKPTYSLALPLLALTMLGASCTKNETSLHRQFTVNAGVADAWRVVAEEFDEVDKWATSVPKSSPIIDSGRISGRTCETSFGKVRERITEFNIEEYVLAYDAQADGMPGFVEGLSTRWKLTPLSSKETQVMVQVTPHLKPGFKMMGPPMKKQLGKVVDETIEDLKHYLEVGSPSARKELALSTPR
ncbi:MAG: SRPBCC family protein [Verrucomicrobiota bacterium]